MIAILLELSKEAYSFALADIEKQIIDFSDL